MVGVVIPAALRQEIERTPSPLPESFGLELLWPLSGSRVVVGPVEVKEPSMTFRKSIAISLERFPRPRRHGWEEGVVPAHLLDEAVSVAVTPCRKSLP